MGLFLVVWIWMCWVVYCKLITSKKLVVLHLCNWCQGGGGVGVCFVFLMTFGDGGFDGDALVVNFEKMMSLEGIKRHVLNKLKTFCILVRSWVVVVMFSLIVSDYLGGMPIVAYCVYFDSNLLFVVYWSLEN